MQPYRWIVNGAMFGALGVLIGAFGAHGLEGNLKSLGYDDAQVERRLDLHETAVRYQMYHAPALILVGLLALRQRSKALSTAGWLFMAGIIIFSGLLYALVFAGDQWKWLGAIVPIGGIALIAGWVMLGYSAKSVAKQNQPPAE